MNNSESLSDSLPLILKYSRQGRQGWLLWLNTVNDDDIQPDEAARRYAAYRAAA